jgi:hypothetical protein
MTDPRMAPPVKQEVRRLQISMNNTRQWMNVIPTTIPKIAIVFPESSGLGRAPRRNWPAANSVAI